MTNDDSQITPKEKPSSSGQHSFNEELETAGSQLVDRVRELVAEGNVRRLIIRNPEGRTLLEVPLTVGAVAGGALVFIAGPMLAALVLLGALVARVRVEIVRDDPEAIEQEVKQAARSAKKKVEEIADDQ
jgi:hypothetical protein